MTLTADYFDDFRAANEEPSGFRDRWYQRRKRDLTMASLSREHYARAFEAGGEQARVAHRTGLVP